MRLKPTEQQMAAIHRQVYVWLFGDVAFAVIPVALIAVIKLIIGRSFGDFFLLKEWSFATIVLLGVAIRRLIRLKIQIQLSPTSYKLDTGVQSLVVLLIAAAVVLALVSLEEMGGVRQMSYSALGAAQMFLFFVALCEIWKAVWAEEHWREAASELPPEKKCLWLLRYSLHQLGAAHECAENTHWAFGEIVKLKVGEMAGKETITLRYQKQCLEVTAALKQAQIYVTELEAQLKLVDTLRAAPVA